MGYVAIATWVVGLVAVAVWQTLHPTFPRVRMPLPGSVVAAELPGGTPVWVAANDDGTVAIFEAISTHRASGLDWAVGWCQEEDAFIDYWGASRWDRRGRYVGGPAPSNLTAYEVVDIDHGSVAVGDRVVAPRRTFGGAGPLGGVCTDRDTDVENPDPATWGRYHVANDARGLSLAQATATRGRVVLEGVAVLGSQGGRFCSAEFPFDAVTETCAGRQLRIVGSPPSDDGYIVAVRVLAAVRGDELTDVLVLPGTRYIGTP